MVLIVFTLHHSFAASQSRNSLRSLGVEETLLVYPTQIKSIGWSGSEHALSQNLKESSLYQNFSIHNSAHIPLDGEYVEPVFIDANNARIDVFDIPANVSSTTAATSTTVLATPLLSPEQSSSSTETANSEEATDMVPAVDEEQDESDTFLDVLETVDTVETSEIIDTDPESTLPLTLKQAADSLYTFMFASMTQVFPFTALHSTTTPDEVVVEPLEKPEVFFTVPTSSENIIPTISDEQTIYDSATATDNLPFSGTTTDSRSMEISPEEQSEDVPAEVPHFFASTTESLVDDNQSNTVSSSTTQEARLPVENTHVLTLQDFGVPELGRGQFLTGAQLRLSLAGQLDEMASGTEQYFEIVYTAGNYTETLGLVVIENEISNALNGGYYLFALPEIAEVADLQNIQVQIIFHGDIEKLDGAFLDSAWLELQTKIITRADLEKRTALDRLQHLARPGVTEFMSSQLDFTRKELPLFNLKYIPQRNFAVRAIRKLVWS